MELTLADTPEYVIYHELTLTSKEYVRGLRREKAC